MGNDASMLSSQFGLKNSKISTSNLKTGFIVKQVPNRLFKKLGAHAGVILHHHITIEHKLKFKKVLQALCRLWSTQV